MKKTILICSILLVALISTSFASGNRDITANVMTSFKQEFASAEVIKFETYDAYIKLTFKENNLIKFAYYSNNAELLAVSRNILSNQLPISLLKSLKKNFAGYWITDLFEIRINDEISYYVGMENSDSTLVLRALDRSSWQVYQSVKKDF